MHPLVIQFLGLDPKGFDVVFTPVTDYPFPGRDVFKDHLKSLRCEYGDGQYWRGELYCSGENGVVGTMNLYVSESDVRIERLYVEKLYLESQMKGFSYYLLGKTRERWTGHRITFQSDHRSHGMWLRLTQKGVVKQRVRMRDNDEDEDDDDDDEFEVLLN